MSAAYVWTKDVRHLAVWTQDQPRHQVGFKSGCYRPLCGGKVREPLDVVFPESRWEDPDDLARAMRNPLCRWCVKTLAALNGVAS